MACARVKLGRYVAHITFAGTYKPGDLPPEGYLEWHEWAEVQRKAKIRQVECGQCGQWKTPQELSQQTREYTALDRIGRQVITTSPVCINCASHPTRKAEK